MRQQRLMPRVLSWWFSQLTGMLAIALAREHSDAVIIEIDHRTATLLSRSGGTTARRLKSSADEAGIQQFARFIASRGDLCRPLLLRLRPAQVLQKRLVLPIAARHNLKEVLSFAIDRETPFTRDEVYWSYLVRYEEAAR